MIHVKTAAGKRALASALAVHAPEVLTDITRLSRCIGGTSDVYVELDDAAAMAAITEDMDEARAAHVKAIQTCTTIETTSDSAGPADALAMLTTLRACE